MLSPFFPLPGTQVNINRPLSYQKRLLLHLRAIIEVMYWGKHSLRWRSLKRMSRRKPSKNSFTVRGTIAFSCVRNTSSPGYLVYRSLASVSTSRVWKSNMFNDWNYRQNDSYTERILENALVANSPHTDSGTKHDSWASIYDVPLTLGYNYQSDLPESC